MCSVCLRKICLTSSGVIRSHGPAGRRAGKPPKVINSDSSEPQDHDNPLSQSQPSESPVPIPIEAHQGVVECFPDVTVVKRIPKAARELCCCKLTATLEQVVSWYDVPSWNRLFSFATNCLRLPDKGSPNEPLASSLKTQLKEEHPPSRPSKPRQSKIKKRRDPMETLARRVSRKIDAGDLRGAIRLASSNETLADYDDSTFSALQSKHPPIASRLYNPLLSHPTCNL